MRLALKLLITELALAATEQLFRTGVARGWRMDVDW